MCGIVGGISFSELEFNKPFIEGLRDTMVHRGPDGAGAWISDDRKIAFGHRRLSIVNLGSEADQPMVDYQNRYVCVFNGEIYNHADLRRELIVDGVTSWRTMGSDTEVVLNGYIHWGLGFLKRLRGMFAIAIWDSLKDELVLVRDRIGVKPLYWSSDGGRLLFASEIKAILKDPKQARELNEFAVPSFLSFISVPAPKTLFKGIYKVPPGCFVKVKRNGEITEHRWYEPLDEAARLDRLSAGEIKDKIEAVLTESVKLRRMADVPVGLFLSGGLDSSINAALFKADGAEDMETFTVGYEGNHSKNENELYYARKMADSIGAKHNEVLISEQDFIDFIPQMIHLQDEPIADPVCMPVHALSQLARSRGIKVCHVGEGADELFFGYPAWRYWLVLQNTFNKFPFLSQVASNVGIFAKNRPGARLSEASSRFQSRQPIFWSTAEGPTSQVKSSLFGDGLLPSASNSGWSDIEPFWSRFSSHQYGNQGALQWMTFVELNVRLPELLLMRVDKMSMGASIEGRVPFLDHKLVELALSIPERHRAKNLVTKPLLKEIFSSRLPREITHRKKQGFGVPINKWIDGALDQEMRAQLKSFCNDTQIFNYEVIENIMNSESRAHAWYLYNFALWYRYNIDGVSQDQLMNLR